MDDPEANPAAVLGRELRRAREAAGLSQDALAAKLGYDRSVIAKAETGDRPPTPDVAAALQAELFPQFPDGFVERLARAARAALKRSGPIPTWFEDWLDAERKAHTLRLWSPVLVPGLLQTAEYARALYLATGLDEEAAGEHVTVRLDRQAMLDRPQPPFVAAVIDEAVLHRLIGSPQAMADQLAHVAEASERPNITIQVVPSGNGANAGLSGGFNLASSDGGPDVLRMEAVEDVTSESRAVVRQAETIFFRLQADALPREASRRLILEAAEQWKAHQA
jgi:transcriptional regulator with XRE-family HTH domain